MPRATGARLRATPCNVDEATKEPLVRAGSHKERPIFYMHGSSASESRVHLLHARRTSRAGDQVLGNVKNETAPRHQKVAAPRGHAVFMKSCDFKSEHLCHFIGRIAQEPCCLCAPRGACARF